MTTSVGFREDECGAIGHLVDIQGAGCPECETLTVHHSSEPYDDVPLASDVLGQLRLLSENYSTTVRKVDRLRKEGPHHDPDMERTRRRDLVEALHRLQGLRERRSSLLELYDLPATTGYSHDDEDRAAAS